MLKPFDKEAISAALRRIPGAPNKRVLVVDDDQKDLTDFDLGFLQNGVDRTIQK